MNTTKHLHIFKPGKWVSMAGEVIEFSQADIEATARAYDPRLHKAPIVIGHPATDDPAQGWAKSLSAQERGLFAEPMKVDPVFAESVNAGRWGTISSKFYRPTDPNNPVPGVWYLRHIGFLGAQPPAVKGMDEPEFAEDDGCVCFREGIEFGDWGMETNASLWRRMREWMLAKFGQEIADQVIPDWQIESIREAARQDDDTTHAAFADPIVSPTHQPHEENHAVTPEQKAALEAENAQLKQKLAAVEAEQKADAAAKRHGDHLAYAEHLVGEGKLAPKHKDAVVAFLDFAGGETAVEFGEGDARQPLVSAFKSFLGDMPKVVEFAEQATHSRATTAPADDDAQFAESADPERIKQHQAIKAHMAEHKVDYATAARAVIK